jgi:hypothetical protein
MLIADGGGGYGGTDWNGMDVVQMWQAVENQDTTAHYRLLTGWQRSYELTLEHLGQVQNYRQSLAEAWPPEKSAASAAYLQRLDSLITNLQSTYDAAVANHSAFASATLALSLSRDDVKKVYDEYAANQTKLDEFKNRPIVISGKGGAPPAKPPVADGRQEQLNNQARTIMFGLSGEILQAQAKITAPPAYDPAGGRGNDGHDDGGATYVPPPIPPVGSYDPSSGQQSGSSIGSSSGGSSSANSRSTTNQPLPLRQPGLVLGGTGPTATLPSPTLPGGGVPPPSVGGALPPGASMQPPFLTVPPGGGSLGGPGGGRPPSSTRGFLGEGLGRPGGGGMPEGVPRAMPPGGIIGGVPGIGLGQPAAGGRVPSRVNPVGGVIGQTGADARSSTVNRAGNKAAGHSMGTLGARNGRQDDGESDPQRWDPDNPWETAEGVAPVVLPMVEQRIDPGPAIGLH